MGLEKVEDQPQKKLLLDPVYKSPLVYRPSDYYDGVAPTYNYYDEFYGADLEAQKEDEKRAILAEGMLSKKAKRRRTCSLCCCTVFYFTFIVILAAVTVIIKLVPKDPALEIGDVKNATFVFNQTAGLEQVNAGLSCRLNVTNRNPHAKAIYQEMNISLFYKNESLGSFNIGAPGPQFEQRRNAMTTLTAYLPNTTTTIGAPNAAFLKSDVENNNVQLDLIGRVTGQFKVLGMKVKKFDVDLDCKLNLKPGVANLRPLLTCYHDS